MSDYTREELEQMMMEKDDEELMWEEIPEHLHSLNEARKLIKEKRKKE